MFRTKLNRGNTYYIAKIFLSRSSLDKLFNEFQYHKENFGKSYMCSFKGYNIRGIMDLLNCKRTTFYKSWEEAESDDAINVYNRIVEVFVSFLNPAKDINKIKGKIKIDPEKLCYIKLRYKNTPILMTQTCKEE